MSLICETIMVSITIFIVFLFFILFNIVLFYYLSNLFALFVYFDTSQSFYSKPCKSINTEVCMQ